MDRFIDECVVDPSLQERLSVLSRVFQNHRAKVQGDSMLFSDEVFAIEPVVSNSWGPPSSSFSNAGCIAPWHRLAFPTGKWGWE